LKETLKKQNQQPPQFNFTFNKDMNPTSQITPKISERNLCKKLKLFSPKQEQVFRDAGNQSNLSVQEQPVKIK